MPVTPDPETTWGLAFAGGFSNPGIKIDLSGLIDKFEYNGAVFQYESTIGVKRDVEINPVSLFGMIGPNKIVSGIASFVGNYEIQVSEYTNIVLGNQLNLQRSKVSYNANRDYSFNIRLAVVAIIIIMALADIAVVYSIGYGFKGNDSAAKIMVGVQQGLYSASLVVLHYLETFGVEAKAELLNLTGQLKAIFDTLTTLANNNGNLADILNPLLTKARIQNIKSVAKNALTNANDKIGSVTTAINAATGQAPVPGSP